MCSSAGLPACLRVQRHATPPLLVGKADSLYVAALTDQRCQQPTQSTAAACRQRIFHFYLPIYFWLEAQLLRHKQTQGGQPLVLGMSAPQGSGKTTLCEQLQALLKRRGYQGIDVSLDDFYLTFADQQALAKVHLGGFYSTFDNLQTHAVGLV